MLTQRQAQCLEFLSSWFATKPYAPSFSDIAEAMNLSSKSGVHRLLASLEERGFIRRLHGRSRALELVDRSRLDPAVRVVELERQLRTIEGGLAAARDALDAIWQYGADTLSGRVDGPDDRKWQRDSVVEMTKRAREARDAIGVSRKQVRHG